LTHTFLAYLKDSASHTHDEPALLDKISQELAALAPSLPKLLGGILFSTSFPTVLDAWITYRNVVHRVHQRFASSTTSHATTSPIRIKVLHSRLLTQLRQARDVFLLANEDRELSNESIICMGFARLQESDDMSEQVEIEMRYGLQILEERSDWAGGETEGRWRGVGWNGVVLGREDARCCDYWEIWDAECQTRKEAYMETVSPTKWVATPGGVDLEWNGCSQWTSGRYDTMA
jgi:hypothetical protein